MRSKQSRERVDPPLDGGRHNPTLLSMPTERTSLLPEPTDALGWNGDAVEAEKFANTAVRTLKGLPISFPGTTGVRVPTAGE